MLGHRRDYFGPATLRDITPLRVEGYQQQRIRKVCPATVNRELALLKHMFNMAERWRLYCGPDPVRAVKFLREDNLQLQTLSETGEQAFLAHCPPDLQDMVLFDLNTGLRSGDLFNLRWEDIDLARRAMTVRVRKTRRLLVPSLNDVAPGLVQAWAGIRKGPHVFFNPATGDRFKDVKNGLKKACKAAGLCGITWHTFRHTFASRLIQRGVDIVTVKELLGHSTVTVTMRYTHTNHDLKAQAVQSLIWGSDKVVTLNPERRKTGSDSR
jgi:integrase